ncbi:MAG TPA: exonuclease subunit SbcD [Candidatus Baltobacteraceae bacterium]|nr:exonuclease subunit SbcD [Candidatus Baltobacteraceae bacterium]
MRLLHTSDWHIGVNHHRLDRQPDHDHVFAQIKNLAIEEQVDVILNTGDLFDKADPGIDTWKYGWSVLEELSSVAPVVIVCGNHDSHKLFQLMDMILKKRLEIYFIHPLTLRRGPESVLQLPTKEGETIRIAAVPFVKSSSYIRDYIEGDPARATVAYADEVGALEHRVGQWLNDPYDPSRDIRVFAAHLLVDGAEVSGSEYQLYVEHDFVTRPDRIPDADYVAFGHIHKPQQIAGLEHGRYAGSPIPINFGERADEKLVYLVTGKPGYALDIKERKLDIGRRLVEIRGNLDTIAADRERYAGSIARVVVEVDNPILQLESRVRELLPETLICQVMVHNRQQQGEPIVAADDYDKPEFSINEMFEAYVKENPGLGESERIVKYFNELYGQVQHGDESEDTLTDLEEVAQ